ncbi:cytochrome P450 [Neoconidiobolus thromboides FSU 785]|nr:cytochrome P450 [Neoconidiobolus thromboides FSU 785]
MLKIILSAVIFSYFIYWSYNVIYSIFFSPLRKIPGPLIYQFFPIIFQYYMWKGTGHKVIFELHKKYGSVVRLGRIAVSFESDSACKELYSTYTYPKSRFYSAFQLVGETIFSTRDKDFHRQRKKILAPSFSEKAIDSIEHIVIENVINLINKIKNLAKEKDVFDLSIYFHYFSFDVIGSLAFGNSFDMLNEGYHPVIGWIKDFFFISILCTMMPILKIYKFKSVQNLYEFAYKAIENSKSHPDRTTILNAFITASDPDTGKKLTEKELAEESIIQLIAGTDTTSNSLAWTFYLLSKHPDIYEKLRQEIANTFPNKDEITFNKCKTECPYLSAVLHESLRIVPVVSGNVMRIVPKGGRIIDGYFIPEDSIVGINIKALHNSVRNWKDPEVFNPDRWIQNKKFKMNSNFMPFLIGPRACIGRTLAWMELYLVSANLIKNFSFELKDKTKELDSIFYVVSAPDDKLDMIATINQ